MRGIRSLIALSALLSTLTGCNIDHVAGLATPNIFHPGTEDYQQARAEKFEPYPQNDMGPPVVGGRPREYQDQTAEVNRALRGPFEPILVPGPSQPAPLPACPPIAQPVIATPPPAIYTAPPAAIYSPPAAQGSLQP